MGVGKSLRKVGKLIKVEASRHMPEILTGMCITGTVSTAVCAVRATPTAMKLIELKKKELNKDRLTIWETVTTCWKCYIWTGLSVATSIGGAIGSLAVSKDRQAVLVGTVAAAETFIDAQSKKIDELYGEGAAEDIRKRIEEDTNRGQDREHPIEVMYIGRGTCLCYDVLSERYFMSRPPEIRNTIAKLNETLYSDNRVTVNQYECAIGLPPIEGGDESGWDINDGFIEPFTGSKLEEGTDIPAFVIDFYGSRAPKVFT